MSDKSQTLATRFERLPEPTQAALLALGEALPMTQRPERRAVSAWAEVMGLSTMPPALKRVADAIGAVMTSADRTAYGPTVQDVMKGVRRDG